MGLLNCPLPIFYILFRIKLSGKAIVEWRKLVKII